MACKTSSMFIPCIWQLNGSEHFCALCCAFKDWSYERLRLGVHPIDIYKKMESFLRQMYHYMYMWVYNKNLYIIPVPRTLKFITMNIPYHAMMEELFKYRLTYEEMWEAGFPIHQPSQPEGRACILLKDYRPPTALHGPSGSRINGARLCRRDITQICSRCRKPYAPLPQGFWDECIYHWGRIHNGVFACCSKLPGTSGCTFSVSHVWTGLKQGVNVFSGFMKTSTPKKLQCLGGFMTEIPNIYAVDCEMVFTCKGMELAKVSFVAMDGSIIYDTYVEPEEEVIDYNTRFSGICYKHLIGAKSLQTVHKDINSFLCSDTILIGHGLDNDLRVLKLVHMNCIDTSLLFSRIMGTKKRRSLKDLAEKILNKAIQRPQMGLNGHNSIEDAAVAMELVMYLVNEMFSSPYGGNELIRRLSAIIR